MITNSANRLQSLVSVIITCYQSGKFLKSALESVFTQSYQSFEIIVINTSRAELRPRSILSAGNVSYLKMPGAPVSAARNRGITESKGNYLVFLDEADLLYRDALLTNTLFLDRYKSTAFVSGSHKKLNEENHVLDCGMNIVLGNHYLHLLQGNYIEMHGAVMYQRWVFDHFRFDDVVDNNSDYDLFLKISRQFPVHHHHKYTAAARVSETRKQQNIPLELKTVQTILKRQRKKLQNKVERECLKNGLLIWENYYCEMLVRVLEMKPKIEIAEHLRELWVLLKYNPKHVMKMIFDRWFKQPEKIY